MRSDQMHGGIWYSNKLMFFYLWHVGFPKDGHKMIIIIE